MGGIRCNPSLPKSDFRNYRWEETINIRALAILDTMWGGRAGKAPRWFEINPNNFSGRRLYKFVGRDNQLLVTNACRELVTNSKEHGLVDHIWLGANLERCYRRMGTNLILVCGAIAAFTYRQIERPPDVRTLFLPHPAARNWTITAMADVAELIQNGFSSGTVTIKNRKIEFKETCG